MHQVGRKVTEESKNTVPVVAKLQVAGSLKFIDKVVPVRVVGVVVRWYEPLVQERDIGRADA